MQAQSEKKRNIIKLYEKTLKGEAKTFDVKRLKEAFSIPDRTFQDWTKNLNDELESQLLQKILDLWLQNQTQEEIAKEIGLSRPSITDKIDKILKFLKEMSENAELPIPTKYEFLAQKWRKMSEFQPIIYNIWKQQSYDSENTHFGKFPQTFMENLLYYYTKPFDVKRLKEAFSIPDRTFSDWTKSLNDELEGQLLEKILDLWLQNKTQEEIGKEVGIPQRTIVAKITGIMTFYDNLAKNAELPIPLKYQFLAEKLNNLAEFEPLLYNI